MPQPKPSGEVVTLPGNSTKTDLVEIMKMAADIIESPEKHSASNKKGCALSLKLLAAGIT